MGVSLRYAIVYSPEAVDHLKALTAHRRRVILDAVDRHLAVRPSSPTRHRKPMRANPLAGWELRVGELRVYYDVEETALKVVVNAVGVKVRNEVRIGGKVIRL